MRVWSSVFISLFCFLMIRRPPRSTLDRSSAASDVYKRQIEKLQELGGKVVACSDSGGYIHDSKGLDLELIKQLKEVERRRIEEYVCHHKHARYVAKGNLWEIPCEVALPCATQNELNGKDATRLVKNGCIAVAEGANMPVTPEGVRNFIKAGIAYGPGKAANAGGVATSALEMQQNASRDVWDFEYTETVSYTHLTLPTSDLV